MGSLGLDHICRAVVTVEELLHATAVTIGASKFDPRRLKDADDVLSVCAGSVIVDKQNATIRLVHYTTQNYFKYNGDRVLPEAQKKIAATCLSYLQYDVFEEGWSRIELDERYKYNRAKDLVPQYPFYGYAAKF